MIWWFECKCSWFGIGIGIGIAVNDWQQSNGMSSDPIPANTLYHHCAWIKLHKILSNQCISTQESID